MNVISFDIDPVAVEKNYLRCKKEKIENILPLILDITNPSPGIGWENKERTQIFERDKPDIIMALALIHHLAIVNNLPLSGVSDFLKNHCEFLIIEFVPKSDSQVKLLLSSRKDIFSEYDRDNFEQTFSKNFRIIESRAVEQSERILYFMKRK